MMGRGPKKWIAGVVPMDHRPQRNSNRKTALNNARQAKLHGADAILIANARLIALFHGSAKLPLHGPGH
jgi:hypothetical protein